MAEKLTDEPCMWDQDVDYELQVELALTIKRLVEHFSAACLSIQHSRSFDAVCTIVPGVAASIMDALLRRLATDQPSEFCAILLGSTVGKLRTVSESGRLIVYLSNPHPNLNPTSRWTAAPWVCLALACLSARSPNRPKRWNSTRRSSASRARP